MVGSRPDKMRRRWAAGGRWTAGGRWAVSFYLLVAAAWVPRARGHMAGKSYIYKLNKSSRLSGLPSCEDVKHESECSINIILFLRKSVRKMIGMLGGKANEAVESSTTGQGNVPCKHLGTFGCKGKRNV